MEMKGSKSGRKDFFLPATFTSVLKCIYITALFPAHREILSTQRQQFCGIDWA